MMMSTNNNGSSVNEFFGNNFIQHDESHQHVAEEKLDQFADSMPNHSLITAQQCLYEHRQHQQQQQQLQRQIAIQQQQQLQQKLEQQLQQQQQQAHFHSQNLSNLNVNLPLENMQGMLNPSSIFAPLSNNPFEPSPIVEKPSMTSSMFRNNNSGNNNDNNSNFSFNVVSSTPATFGTTDFSSKPAPGDIPAGINRTKKLLPLGFEPSDKNIICGNKRKYFESKGNIRFRSVCRLFTNDYHSAPTKVEKSAVVSQVMAILREGCPDSGASIFVTPQGGRWYAVSERTSREKVGTFFRDCLADTYKSSAKNKIAKRKQVKQERSSCGNSSNDGSVSSSTNAPKPLAAVGSAPAPFEVTNGHHHQHRNHYQLQNIQDNTNTKEEDDGSLGSMSFYDVNDLTSVSI